MSGPRSRYASGDPSAGAPAEDLTAPTPPAPQSLASSATTASVTWTHAGAPGGTTYAIAVVDEAGTSVTPSSGSGLGPYVIPVASGKAYSARLTATGTDGQTAQSSALVAVAAAASTAGAWTRVGGLTFIGATPQTFATIGDKTVTLADASTITVNAANTAGGIASTTSGVDADRGLIIDVPPAIASTAIRLRFAVPVSPSVATSDDLLVSFRWRCDMGTTTAQRAVVGVVPSGGTETTASFSGSQRLGAAGNTVKLQTRKAAVFADVAASIDTDWRDGTVLIQDDVRVVGSSRMLLVSEAPRDIDSEAPTYVANIGGDASGPDAGLEPVLFSGSTISVILYGWNGGASGGSVELGLEQIDIYTRDPVTVP